MNDGVGGGAPMMEEEELQDNFNENDDDANDQIIIAVGEDEEEDERMNENDQEEEEEDEEEINDNEDDDEEGEQDNNKRKESLWRNSFVQTCLRIARNDESLVRLNHPMDWLGDYFMATTWGSVQCTNEEDDEEDTHVGPVAICMSCRGYWKDADVMLLGHALSHNTHLRSLTLDTSICQCCNKNYLSDASIHALQRGLSLSHLHQLTMDGLCSEFQNLLLQGVFVPPPPLEQPNHSSPLQPTLTIQRLHLSQTILNMNVFATTLTAFQHWHQLLTHLSLTSCSIDDDGMQLLTSLLLTSARALSFLDLSHNDITDVGVRHFCETCWNLPSSEACDDDDNEKDHKNDEEYGLDDKDKSIHTNNNNISSLQLLQVLNLGYNEIELDGMHMLFRSIRLQEQVYNNNELHTLILSGNTNIGHQGLSDVGRIYLPNRDDDDDHKNGVHLKHLEMAKCATNEMRNLGVTTREAVHALMNQAMAVYMGVLNALAHGLSHNTSLVSLDVGENILLDQGINNLMEAIAVHPTLRKLSLASNSNIGVAGLVQVAKMLPFVRLHELNLNDTCSIPFYRGLVGLALLHGVQRNHFLTSFSMEELDDCWNEPIQFHVEFNKTCRPLFCNVNHNDSIATATTDDNNNPNNNFPPASIWPHAFAQLHRKNNVSHVYFLLSEQPWVIPTTSTS